MTTSGKSCVLSQSGYDEIYDKLKKLNEKLIRTDQNEYKTVFHLQKLKEFLKSQNKKKNENEKIDDSQLEKLIGKEANTDTLRKILAKEECKRKPVVKKTIEILFESLDLTFEEKYIQNPKTSKSNSNISENEKDKENTIVRPERNQKIFEYLRSLDCKEQLNQINNRQNNRQGFFILKTPRNTRKWFLWRLGSNIYHFDKGKRYVIDIKQLNQQIKSNDLDKAKKILYLMLYEYVNAGKNTKNVKDIKDKLYNDLADLAITESIIIILNNFDCLNKEVSDQLLNTCDSLFKSVTNRNHEANLFVFLLVECSPKKCNKDMIVEFETFPITEIRTWFNINENNNENNDRDPKYKWEENREQIIDGYENKANQNPFDLIEEICINIFELEGGIADVEHYWKNLV